MPRWHRCHDGLLPAVQTKANRKRGKPQKEKETNYLWKKAIVRTAGEPKARQQIQRKEPPFHLPPSDDDTAGAPGPKKKERVRSEFEPTHGHPPFPFLYKL